MVGALKIAVALGMSAVSVTARDRPPGPTVLSGETANALFDQCSRQVPDGGSAVWRPAVEDALALERMLIPALKKRHPEIDWTGFPERWERRYVGVIRANGRYVYGDYYPLGSSDVCDGGPSYFGAEYDVRSKRISHLAFNGVA